MATYNGVVLQSGGSTSLSLVSGDVANYTTVNLYGKLNVSNGGTANDTVVNLEGGIFIWSGGSASATTVNFGGTMRVSSGGITTATTVNSGGSLAVLSGGTANGVVQSSGGNVNAAISGGDTSTVISGSNTSGYFYYSNGVASNFMLYRTGYQNVLSGGTALKTTVQEGAIQTLHSSGVASRTVLSSGGSLVVSTGAAALDIDQKAGGNVITFVTGGDSKTVVTGSNANDSFSLSGGVASNFVLYDGGNQTVSSGGITNNLTLSGGILYLQSGGRANNVTQEEGGNINFSAYGNDSASLITGSNAKNGSRFTYSNGVASGFTVYLGGRIAVVNGGSATNNTVSWGGILNALSGGTATNNTVSSGGILSVDIGGSATGINQLEGGNVNLNVLSGDSTTLISGNNAGGRSFLYSNGIASDFELNAGGTMLVFNHGIASGTWINSGGSQEVNTRGSAVNTVINSGGTLTVVYGGSALSVSQQSGGELFFNVYGGDSASVVSGTNANGGFSVQDGVASNLLLYGNAEIQLLSGLSSSDRQFPGAVASNTTLSGGLLTVCSTASAVNVQLNSDGILLVESGGTATGVTQEQGGTISFGVKGDDSQTLISGSNDSGTFLYSNGTATNFILYKYDHYRNDEYQTSVSSGGRMVNTTIASGGSLWIKSAGTTYRTRVYEAGVQCVHSNGTASNTSVYSGGTEYIDDGKSYAAYIEGGSQVVGYQGLASATVVVSGGIQVVSLGGNAAQSIVSSGGFMLVSSGGSVTGLTAEGIVTALSGAIFSGTIAVGGSMHLAGAVNTSAAEINMVTIGRTATDSVIINNLGYFSSTTTYSVTVDPTAYGTYRLASGAQNFRKSVTVKDSAGKRILSLSPGTSSTVDTTTYTLVESGAQLYISLTEHKIGPGPDPVFTVTYPGSVTPAAPEFTITTDPLPAGFFSISGEFGNINAAIEVYDSEGWLITGGAIINGEVSFRPVYLDTFDYTIVVRNTDNGTTGGDFKLTLRAEQYVNANDNWDDMKTAGDFNLPSEFSLGVINNDTRGKAIVTDYVGYADTIDYRRFTLEDAAKLTLNIWADGKTVLTVYELQEKSNGTYSLKKIKSVSAKANENGILKDMLLDKGTYYFSVSSPDAKKGGNALYTVSVNDASYFYTEGNNRDDWTDLKTAGPNSTQIGDWGKITGPGHVLEDWVGFGDTVDYKRFSLDSAARLTLDLIAGNSTKFAIYRLVEGKNGTWSLKQAKSVTVSASKNANTLSKVLLESGTYYLMAQSTNASKGNSSNYTVSVSSESIFYTDGDNGRNDWVDMKTAGANSKQLDRFGTVNAIGDKIVDYEWVGYGDTVDYTEFSLNVSTKLTLDLEATDSTKFVIYQLTEKKDGSFALKSVKSVTVSAAKKIGEFKDVLLENGTYYLLAQSTNASKGGNSYYSVTVGSETVFAKPERDADSNLVRTFDNNKIQVSDWVGYGDETDSFLFQLDSNSRLSFNLILDEENAIGKIKVTLYDAVTNKKVSLDKNLVSTQELLAGDYRVEVETSNAKKYYSDYTLDIKIA